MNCVVLTQIILPCRASLILSAQARLIKVASILGYCKLNLTQINQAVSEASSLHHMENAWNTSMILLFPLFEKHCDYDPLPHPPR